MIHLSKCLLVGVAFWQCTPLPVLAEDKTVEVCAKSVVAYIRSCRKANGAFGPADQEYTDAAWNYPAVHALRLLGARIPDADRVKAHGLGYPSGHAGYGHWLVYHQALTPWLLTNQATALQTPPDADRPAVRLVHQGFDVRYYGSPFGTGGDAFFKVKGASTSRQFRAATELGYYNLPSLYYLLAALHADGRHPSNPDDLARFILQRQAPNGGFVDLRVPDKQPVDTDTHIAHTYHAVASLNLLNVAVPNSNQCIAFARRCQIAQPPTKLAASFGIGGFLFDPDVDRPGNYPDVYYTLAGLQILSLLDAEPVSIPLCVQWVIGLQNHDGGFGDRPGWRSRLYSTYYAVHSLALLAQAIEANAPRPKADQTPQPSLSPQGRGCPKGGRGESAISAEFRSLLANLMGAEHFDLPARIIPTRRLSVPDNDTLPDSSMRIHQGLFKTPVVEANDLAGLKDRGFNLLAVKTADFATVDGFLRTGEASQRSMEILLCPEAYPHRLRRHGGAALHHVGNFTLDAHWSERQREIWRAADEAGKQGLAWADYQQQVLRPLQQLGSLCYPEQDFELEYAYSAYDDGLYGRGGYNAMQVGFNWSPRDFVRVFPWRERYTDKLPPVADADAHGDLAKWSPQLDHTRHLYISRGASYRDFVDAARDGRVVCVVVGVEGVPSGVSYYGAPGSVQFVKERVDEWKWW
jgi:prenyltransferase beta subunit